jgi:hypothetical protein
MSGSSNQSLFFFPARVLSPVKGSLTMENSEFGWAGWLETACLLCACMGVD